MCIRRGWPGCSRGHAIDESMVEPVFEPNSLYSSCFHFLYQVRLCDLTWVSWFYCERWDQTWGLLRPGLVLLLPHWPVSTQDCPSLCLIFLLCFCILCEVARWRHFNPFSSGPMVLCTCKLCDPYFRAWGGCWRHVWGPGLVGPIYSLTTSHKYAIKWQVWLGFWLRLVRPRQWFLLPSLL